MKIERQMERETERTPRNKHNCCMNELEKLGEMIVDQGIINIFLFDSLNPLPLNQFVFRFSFWFACIAITLSTGMERIS